MKKLSLLLLLFIAGCTSGLDDSTSNIPSNETTDSTFSTTVTTDTTYVDSSSDTTIVSKFRVVFDKQGGSGGTLEVLAVLGEAMPVAEPPERLGYHFLGYFDESLAGEKYYNADMTSARNWDKAEEAILYAHWEEIDNTNNLLYTKITDGIGFAYTVRKAVNDLEGKVIIPAVYDGLPVIEIEPSAFIDCPKLLQVIFENESNIRTIGSSAFKNCWRLTTMTIPNSVQTINSGIFNGCGYMTSLILPFIGQSRSGSGTYMLFGFIFGNTSYTGGVSVNQYSSSSVLSTYCIPSSLKEVTFTDQAVLHYGAFYACKYLINIYLPNNLLTINSRVFYGCSELKEMMIPATVTTINEEAFSNCDKLANIYVADESPNFQAVDDILYTFDTRTLIRYSPAKSAATFISSSRLEKVAIYAFHNARNLKNIVMQDNVTMIERSAFNGCSGMNAITLPFIGINRSIPAGDWSLFGCIFGSSFTGGTAAQQYSGNSSFIVTNYIPSLLREVNITDANNIHCGAFSRCANLTTINISGAATTIGGRAFYQCTNLKSLSFPETITSIDAQAFYDCKSLNSIILDDSIAIIGNQAFYGWTSSQKIYVRGLSEAPAAWTSGGWLSGCNAQIIWNYQGE